MSPHHPITLLLGTNPEKLRTRSWSHTHVSVHAHSSTVIVAKAEAAQCLSTDKQNGACMYSGLLVIPKRKLWHML